MSIGDDFESVMQSVKRAMSEEEKPHRRVRYAIAKTLREETSSE